MSRPVPAPPPLTSPLRQAVLRALDPQSPTIPDQLADPQLCIAYWNHPCGDGCRVWVPHHRDRCTEHTVHAT